MGPPSGVCAPPGPAARHNDGVNRTPGTVPAERRRRPGYDRDSLLEIAVATFNERGYDGTSMEDLSHRLGYRPRASRRLAAPRPTPNGTLADVVAAPLDR